jgi:hypothetical protein
MGLMTESVASSAEVEAKSSAISAELRSHVPGSLTKLWLDHRLSLKIPLGSLETHGYNAARDGSSASRIAGTMSET